MPQNLRFKYHDGGRCDAGFKGRSGDCAVRAIAIAMRKPYRKTRTELADLQAEMTMGLDGSVAGGVYLPVLCEYMRRQGWVLVETKGCYFNADAMPSQGAQIAVISNASHFVAVCGGTVMDTWDSRQSAKTKCGNPKLMGYWHKPMALSSVA